MAIQGFSVNFIISLSISLGLAFVASSLFGEPIRDAVQSKEVTKQDITRMLLSSPYLWAGLVCFVLLAVFLYLLLLTKNHVRDAKKARPIFESFSGLEAVSIVHIS